MNLQITQLNLPDRMIDLGVGQPDPSLLPLAAIKRAAEHRLGSGDPSLLQYGTEQGNGHFRDKLACFLTRGYRSPVDPEHMFITSGASSGIDLVCACFTKPGDTVFVEEPTYFLALRLFADRRLNVVGLPTDADGLDMKALEEKVAETAPAFVYIVPTFHNPSGVTLTATRREQLERLSETYDFFVVADEVYHLLAYTEEPPPPMASFNRSGKVISVGSFAKILAPGLRLGWIQAAPGVIRQLANAALLKSGGGMNPFTSAVVQSVIELGLQQGHLDRVITIYGRRASNLVEAVRKYLPDSVVFEEPRGGFFLWLHLPEGMDARILRKEAAPKWVNFQPGPNFSATGGLGHFIRLCFVYYGSDKLREGVKRLGEVMLHSRMVASK
jgi:DNA-binding transcriptional MocR family regulator